MRSALLAGLVLLLTGCDWISLAAGAVSYQTVGRGEAANLAALDSLIYVTRAEDGLAIIDLRSRTTVATLPPPAGSESIDDVAVAGDKLFVLDARSPGHLSAFSLADPLAPRLVAPPLPVPVEPFAGLSCAQDRCVVSGGTSQLTVWLFDRAGALRGPVATADLGRGQPDALLAPDGRLVFVSTHYQGPRFGLDVLMVDGAGTRLDRLAELPIDGAGFTAGGSKPANFPLQSAALGSDTVLVAFRRGLAVISCRTPDDPGILALVDLGAPAVSVSVAGHTALVALAGREPSLAFVDFSGASPRIIRRIALPAGTRPSGVVLTGSHAAVAARSLGVMVFDR